MSAKRKLYSSPAARLNTVRETKICIFTTLVLVLNIIDIYVKIVFILKFII